MSAVDGSAEVSTAFQDSSGAVQAIVNTTMLHMNAERSDDDESDHTSDPYTSHMRGRVSPSPYTANTERARLFNGYVRGIIEQKLNVLVPISHQPRDLVTEIIADASAQFPEFASCVRKRIRTFLKSYRRSRKLKDGSIPIANGIGKLEDNSHSPSPLHTSPNPASNTPVVTIFTENPHAEEEEDLLPPDSKRIQLSVSSPTSSNGPVINSAGIMAVAAAAAASSSNSNNNSISSSNPLSNHEEHAVRQLITGYRESAAFLERAANQLEAMLHNNNSST